jgi:hypothetical protein
MAGWGRLAGLAQAAKFRFRLRDAGDTAGSSAQPEGATAKMALLSTNGDPSSC